jgi:hypothetical protein
MPQYAALIYAPDSAHAPDATPEDLAECDDHAAELLAADAMLRIARTNPVARTPGSGVEVRPVHSGGVIRAPRD